VIKYTHPCTVNVKQFTFSETPTRGCLAELTAPSPLPPPRESIGYYIGRCWTPAAVRALLERWREDVVAHYDIERCLSLVSHSSLWPHRSCCIGVIVRGTCALCMCMVHGQCSLCLYIRINQVLCPLISSKWPDTRSRSAKRGQYTHTPQSRSESRVKCGEHFGCICEARGAKWVEYGVKIPPLPPLAPLQCRFVVLLNSVQFDLDIEVFPH